MRKASNAVLILGIVGAALGAGGCLAPFFQNEILNFIGPTTAVAVAESSGIANSGQAVLLDGSESFLALGSGQTVSASAANFTFQWSITSTPPNAVQPTLANANTSQPTFTGTTPGAHVVQLTVSDGTYTGSNSVTIVVQ